MTHRRLLLTLACPGATNMAVRNAMVLRQLEYLAALAREKHFGRAAQACHVTQPTLSAAIRLLEDDLGAPIVERGHRFVGLTAQGRLVLDHAHRILAEAENLRRGLDEIDRDSAAGFGSARFQPRCRSCRS